MEENQINARLSRVLLVDDEPSVLQVLSQRLKTQGYEVFTATDGEEALQKADREHPDVILLDIMLPKKNGNAVAAELREKQGTAKIPIIFITCLISNNEARVMHYQSGGQRILGKPIDSRVLVQLIEEVCMH